MPSMFIANQQISYYYAMHCCHFVRNFMTNNDMFDHIKTTF